MYPSGELSLIAIHKSMLRVRIAQRRRQCAEAGAVIARPFHFIDRARAQWRSIAPIAKVVGIPLTAFFARKFLGKATKLAVFVKMAPLAMRTARAVAGWAAK